MTKKIKDTYQIIYNKLPKKIQNSLTNSLYSFGLKPTSTKEKSPFNKAIVVFSADFELSWAFRFSKKNKNYTELGLQERNNFPKILEQFNRYNIPVTWATVGHLFLSECKCVKKGIAHPDMPRPEYFENKNWLFNGGDWYQHDPCSDFNNSKNWYAPDLIQMILDSSVDHEIGCHTFSHIDFTYKNCSKKLADAEITKCIELASNLGVSLKSMVFPGGTAGNYEILRKNGFSCYRKQMNSDLDIPKVDKYSLVAIPSSTILERTKDWSYEKYLKVLDVYLKKAIKKQLVLHFWFHPSMDPWFLNNVLSELLKKVQMYNEKEQIELLTMGKLAERVLMNETA